jgi:hypothetical protein
MNNTTTYVVNALILVTVLRQVRGTELNLVNLLVPVAAVAFSAAVFLHSIPTAGNDLGLILALAGAGVLLGLLGGLAVRIERGRGKVPVARAGLAALLVLVIGPGARLAFAYGAQHVWGADVARFSRDHLITGQQAWVAALVLMALSEVVVRLAVTRVRGALFGRRLVDAADAAPAGRLGVA